MEHFHTLTQDNLNITKSYSKDVKTIKLIIYNNYLL